ncbi:hypothetical protein [Chamaesiphon sp.]|uniref:hypothetical protein n=1 Tax=Chamaesiphon sp. TaxID=2814140 RepID=UPI0035946A1D
MSQICYSEQIFGGVWHDADRQSMVPSAASRSESSSSTVSRGVPSSQSKSILPRTNNSIGFLPSTL